MNHSSNYTDIINRKALILIAITVITVIILKVGYSMIPTYSTEGDGQVIELSDSTVVLEQNRSPQASIVFLLTDIKQNSGIVFSDIQTLGELSFIDANTAGKIPTKLELYFEGQDYQLVTGESSTSKRYYSNTLIACEVKISPENNKLLVSCLEV